MLTQDVRIHFQGFHPSEKTEQRLDNWARDLHEISPSEACLKAVYSKHGREYQGEIRITSRAGHFYTIARGPNLYAVARDLVKRMRRQLDRWKTVRFNQHQEVRHQIINPPSTDYAAS
jgi:ribosome-associated translation inhibitor RaiA